MLSVGGRQMHEIWSVLGKKRILGEICAEPSGAEDDRAALGEISATLLVHEASAIGTVHCEFVRPGLGDDPSFVATLRNFFDHLDEGICNGHAWEPLLTSVSARHRVPTKSGDQRQIEIEFFYQPIDIITAVPAQHFH